MSLPTINLSRHSRFYIAKRYFKGHSDAQSHPHKTENEFRDMMEEAKPKRPTLEGEEALKKWREGREAWLMWHHLNLGNISFAGVDFSHERDSKGDLSFSDFGLRNSTLNFSGTTFGNGSVDFSKATFDGGSLDFSNAIFGGGEVNFSYITLDKGNLDFLNTTFGDVELSFRQAKIKNLSFNPKNIGTSHIEAEGLSIKGRAVFDLPPSAINLKSFNLRSASFEGPLTLKGDLSIVPDLRATRYSHQVDLSDLKVKLPRTSIRFGWPPKLLRKAEDPQDGARLRRLKEIAETNKDHQAALRFSADENRARRWIETSWPGSVLDMVFSFFSDYGQSILRPVLALLAIFFDWASIYLALATGTLANWWTGLAQAFILSASNSLPFLPQSRDLREDALKVLYGTDPGLCIDILMIAQGALSFVFLFLIGLGLRNRFRL